MDKEISVAVVSEPIGKSPEEVACSFVFDEVHRLARKGVNVHVIRGKIEEDSTSYGIHFHGMEKMIDPQALNMLIKNITFYPPISLLRNPVYLYWENLYALNVSKIIEKYNLDLIHAHFAYREGLVGLLAKARTKKPLVVTSHGYDLNILHNYKYGIRRYPQYDKLVRLVMREGDLIIVPCRLLYKRALEAGAYVSKVIVIPNAVDISVFNPNINGLEFRKKYRLSKEPLVLTIRNLRPWYRVDKVLDVAEIVLKKINAYFFVIGDGELRDTLIRAAKKRKINHKVHFVGKVPHSEIPKALAAADIVFDPCPIGQGINVLEAMAHAKPVVGIDTKGMWDYVVDKETGFLVDFANNESIAEKIIYLIQNEEEAVRMGVNGRKLVEREYNMEKRTSRIFELYKKIIG